MKVLHVTPYFYGAWAYGGIPRLSFHLCAALVKMGVQVEAVTTDALDRQKRRDELRFAIEGVPVRAYKNLSNALAYDLQLFWPTGLSAEKPLLKDYDLVHIHGHRNFLNTRMSSMANAAQVPVVMEPNGTLVNIERRQVLKTGYDLLFGNRQVKNTDLFLAVSDAEKKQFTELGIPEQKVRVVANGVFVDNPDPPVSFKEKFGIKNDYILYLGKITPRKGIEYAIEALKYIPDPKIIAVIAGNDMGFESKLKALAANWGLSDRVLFTGLLTTPLKEAAFREALVTVYAGVFEIFGLVQFESILCGTPAIVADDCGAGEWVRRSGGGWVVPYGNGRAIAQIILDQGRTKDRAGLKAAQDWVKKNLSWEAVAGQVKQIYEEVLRSQNDR